MSEAHSSAKLVLLCASGKGGAVTLDFEVNFGFRDLGFGFSALPETWKPKTVWEKPVLMGVHVSLGGG